MIRNVDIKDAEAIAEIYNHYILNSIITFEEIPLEVDDMAKRISEQPTNRPWLVWEENGEVMGYAYAGIWKTRTAYRNTVESSIYLKNGFFSRGIGTKLYRELLDQIKIEGHHAVLAGISMPNEHSVSLHEKLGFQKVGQLKEVGYKLGKWIDVGYWQIVFK